MRATSSWAWSILPSPIPRARPSFRSKLWGRSPSARVRSRSDWASIRCPGLARTGRSPLSHFRGLAGERPGRSRLCEGGHRGDRAMSNNLALAQVAAAQNNKETTINDEAGQLDAGLTDKVDVALTGTTSPLVLSDAQALRCMVLKLTGTNPGGAYAVHCPTNKKIYVVWNGTAGTSPSRR